LTGFAVVEGKTKITTVITARCILGEGINHSTGRGDIVVKDNDCEDIATTERFKSMFKDIGPWLRPIDEDCSIKEDSEPSSC
jgi:hypothetical protein